MAAETMGAADSGSSSIDKEYQSLFWLPMMYQTVDTAVGLVDNMLEDIDAFQDGLEREARLGSLSCEQQGREEG